MVRGYSHRHCPTCVKGCPLICTGPTGCFLNKIPRPLVWFLKKKKTFLGKLFMVNTNCLTVWVEVLWPPMKSQALENFLAAIRIHVSPSKLYVPNVAHLLSKKGFEVFNDRLKSGYFEVGKANF